MQNMLDQEIADRPQALPGARGVMIICFAYGQPRPVGVEVVTLTDEALDLHAPSIRMETTKCLVTKPPEKFCGISA